MFTRILGVLIAAVGSFFLIVDLYKNLPPSQWGPLPPFENPLWIWAGGLMPVLTPMTSMTAMDGIYQIMPLVLVGCVVGVGIYMAASPGKKSQKPWEKS
jgi:hypothetical protein